MYVIYNKDHIHHLLNESKKWKVSYIWDWREHKIKRLNKIITRTSTHNFWSRVNTRMSLIKPENRLVVDRLWIPKITDHKQFHRCLMQSITKISWILYCTDIFNWTHVLSFFFFLKIIGVDVSVSYMCFISWFCAIEKVIKLLKAEYGERAKRWNKNLDKNGRGLEQWHVLLKMHFEI